MKIIMTVIKTITIINKRRVTDTHKKVRITIMTEYGWISVLATGTGGGIWIIIINNNWARNPFDVQ